MHPMCIEGSRHPVDTLDCVVLIGIVEGQIPVVSAHLTVPVPGAALAVLSIPGVIISIESSEGGDGVINFARRALKRLSRSCDMTVVTDNKILKNW